MDPEEPQQVSLNAKKCKNAKNAKIVLKIHKVLGRPVLVSKIRGCTALEKV